MLTRRRFAGLASCALCTLSGFVATDVSAQDKPPPAASGLKRKILSQIDGPTPGYVTINAEVEIDPGIAVARHTHPGIESSYVLEGEINLEVQGQPARTFKVGDGFQVPPVTPHGGRNGDRKTRLAINYIVEKDKPLASPA
jgi:quercetin dioxygenase-like cupin family protein